jgi:hypothetical protein
MKTNGVVYTPTTATTVSSPEPGMQRQVLAYNQNVMLVRHHFVKGWKGTSHSHPHEQLVYTAILQLDGWHDSGSFSSRASRASQGLTARPMRCQH